MVNRKKMQNVTKNKEKQFFVIVLIESTRIQNHNKNKKV